MPSYEEFTIITDYIKDDKDNDIFDILSYYILPMKKQGLALIRIAEAFNKLDKRINGDGL